MEVYEYRIVKVEKGFFFIKYKTVPYGIFVMKQIKKFKTKPKAEDWVRKNIIIKDY